MADIRSGGEELWLTIAIPTFNRADMLRGALQALTTYDLSGVEILVSDNGSADETQSVLAACGEPRLRINRNERNIGLFENLNLCLSLARTPFILFLSDDDRIDAGLIPMARAMLDTPGLAAAVLSCRFLKEESSGTSEILVEAHLASGIYDGDLVLATLFREEIAAQLCSVVFNVARLRSIGGFPCDHRYSGDVITYAKAFLGAKVAFEPAAHATYVIHAGSESSRIGMKDRLGDFAAVLREIAALAQALPQERCNKLSRSMDFTLATEASRQGLMFLRGGGSRRAAVHMLWPIARQLSLRERRRLIARVGFELLPLRLREAVWTGRRFLQRGVFRRKS